MNKLGKNLVLTSIKHMSSKRKTGFRHSNGDNFINLIAAAWHKNSLTCDWIKPELCTHAKVACFASW